MLRTVFVFVVTSEVDVTVGQLAPLSCLSLTEVEYYCLLASVCNSCLEGQQHPLIKILSFSLPWMSLLPSFDFPHSHPFILVLSPHQGLPPVLPPLPKRPALEKANGATTIFNAGIFPYQQALANMQFQQQAAFIPSGEAWAFFNVCLWQLSHCSF